MKVAFATDDGKTISAHFGRASHYMVVTIQDGQLVQHEMRAKPGHDHFAGESHPEHDAGQPHGFDPASQDRHTQMAKVISDCEAVVCRGMGRGAYESMRARNIRPFVTDVIEIDEAALAYANGRIVDHTERLH
jgi:predicted Fe-Mo cluster-binding NifX family protein